MAVVHTIIQYAKELSWIFQTVQKKKKNKFIRKIRGEPCWTQASLNSYTFFFFFFFCRTFPHNHDLSSSTYTFRELQCEISSFLKSLPHVSSPISVGQDQQNSDSSTRKPSWNEAQLEFKKLSLELKQGRWYLHTWSLQLYFLQPCAHRLSATVSTLFSLMTERKAYTNCSSCNRQKTLRHTGWE